MSDEPASIIGQLVAQRDQGLAAKTLDMDLPGWDGQLVVRCGAIEKRTWQALQRRQANAGADVDADLVNQDIILAATKALCHRNGKGVEELTGADGLPLRFDERLAEMFSLEAKNARGVLLGMVAYRNTVPMPGTALDFMGGTLLRWLSGQQQAEDEEVLGE